VRQQRRRRSSTVRPVLREHPQPPTAEDFLNGVLGAGQPAPREKELFVDDGLPVEPWGQRVKRPFLWLWIGLLALTVTGAGWTVADLWARNRAVKRHLAAARAGLIEMSALSLQQAHDEATRAIARNPASVTAVAALANARAFALLVYGDGQLADVETAIVAARQRIKNENGDADGDDIAQGERELMLGRAAFILAAQNRGADVANELKAARADLDGALASWPEEPLVYWLNGLARLASGDRAGARDALKQAQTLGLTMARVALADMDLDEGALVAAGAGYEEVLRSAPQHSLARAGRALAKADAGLELEATLKEMEAQGGMRVDGKRAEAWHRLAIATLARKLGDPDRAKIELDAAVSTGTAEPRFLARAALAMLDEGRFEDAFTARTRVRSRAADMLLPVIDAELLLAGGRPDEAMKTIGAADDLRARRLRGRALLDVGRAGDAVVLLGDALAKTPDDVELKAWLALAKLTASPSEGVAPLARLATDTAPPSVRAILGEAYLLTGDTARARAAFEAALTGNPLAYRAGARLAELSLAAGKPADAENLARTALASAPGYLPAHSVLGRALVAVGRQSDAAPELQLVVDAGRASAADEVAYAEAALASGEPELARAALLRAREKGASLDSVTRVAALVEPQLVAELRGGAAAAPAAAAEGEEPKPAPRPAAPKKKRRR
jgi:tetratricopeptide (TPR) repeat protein